MNCINEEIPFEIPNTWCFSRLQAITIKDIKRGKAPKYTENSDILVFAQKCNLKAGGINLELAQFLEENIIEKYPNSEYMQYGDTVINSTGTGTLGRVGFYKIKGKKVVPDSHVTTVRVSDTISKEYVYYFLKSRQSILEKSGEGSTNQKELKPDTIKQLIVPLPPYNEQLQIIKKIKQIYINLSQIEMALNQD